MDAEKNPDNRIPTDERRESTEPCYYCVLCREDKAQLDRIESMLLKLIGGE